VILYLLLAAALLAALPSAIRSLIETGPYLFTARFFADMVARLSGPGRLRFILQPAVATILGVRDGKRDARLGLPPFLWSLACHKVHKPYFLRSAVASVQDLVAVAILLDMISQFLIFRFVHPGAALLLGPVLIALPYALSRSMAHRIAQWHIHRRASLTRLR
jgi:hypothetical protein